MFDAFLYILKDYLFTFIYLVLIFSVLYLIRVLYHVHVLKHQRVNILAKHLFLRMSLGTISMLHGFVHVRLNGVKYMLLLNDSNVNGHGCTGVIILNMHHASGRSSCIITIIYYELRINLHDEVACVLGTVVKISVISLLYYISFGSLSWTYFHVIEFPITHCMLI